MANNSFNKFFIIILITSLAMVSCKKDTSDVKIIFLHHSTGEVIYNGHPPTILKRIVSKISNQLSENLFQNGQLPKLISKYNKGQGKSYSVKRMEFPKDKPYGWNNYPYDYYNIWVKHAGDDPYLEEPTLEMLTREYKVIIFKHCFPVSNIKTDQESADINSYFKSLANYKLQYDALKEKMHSFADTKFVLFTGAALVESQVTEEAAVRAREFFQWVTDEWDEPDDNIFIWDLYSLETEGGLYLKDEYAVSHDDSHPNRKFAHKVSQLLFNRIIDVIENNGKNTSLTGYDL